MRNFVYDAYASLSRITDACCCCCCFCVVFIADGDADDNFLSSSFDKGYSSAVRSSTKAFHSRARITALCCRSCASSASIFARFAVIACVWSSLYKRIASFNSACRQRSCSSYRLLSASSSVCCERSCSSRALSSFSRCTNSSSSSLHFLPKLGQLVGNFRSLPSW